MNVSAIIVTRGNVDVRPILDSLPPEWEKVVWDNGGGSCSLYEGRGDRMVLGMKNVVNDKSVYGRYAAIEYATNELIYVQDDDCIVSDPHATVDPVIQEMFRAGGADNGVYPFPVDFVCCNMPEPWRSLPFYTDHALVGFGAAFHRDAPKHAFSRFAMSSHANGVITNGVDRSWFDRQCDMVFTGLTPRFLVDIPHESLDYAFGADRMWQRPTHKQERDRMLALVRDVKGER